MACSKPDAPPPDAPPPDAASPAPSASPSIVASATPSTSASTSAHVEESHEECHIVGTYEEIGGKGNVVTFRPDATGDWVGKTTLHFTWGLDKGATILTLESNANEPGPYGCPAGQIGRYKLTVDGCVGIDLALEKDPCAARSKALGASKGKRKRNAK